MNVLVCLVLYGTTVLVALAIGFAIPLGHRPLLVAGTLFGRAWRSFPSGSLPYRQSEAWSGSPSHSLGSCSHFALEGRNRRSVIEIRAETTADVAERTVPRRGGH